MIRSIVGASLRFRLLVLGIAAAVMVVGITQLRNAPTDVLPEFTPPYVEVQTEALGLSAEEVEQLITVPLEADLLNGVEGIDTLRSESLPGLSSITMVFEPGTDIYKARQLVQEPLTQAHALPNVSKAPTMLQPLSSSSRVMMIALSSDKLSAIDKSVIARWTMRPRLMGVPGVANVSIFGMRDQQLQVQVDPRTLRDKDVTLRQVIATTGNAQVASPVSYLEASTPGTGGFIETPQQRLQVRNVFDNIATPKELGKVPVEGTNGRLRLTDVSNVVEDHQPLIGDAIVNDRNGLLLVVEKFPGANTLEVTKGVEEALDKLKPGLTGMQVDSSVFRPASFIEDAIDNLTLGLVIAGILLALILTAFLFRWRTVLIALVTIPVSLVAAALVLDLLGETFNAISFAGLAVALAIVIDEAVVGSANVARRLGEQREKGGDTSIAQIVSEASQEVRSPLAYATLIALLAIVPVAVMAGRPGAFFEPLALSYTLAIAAGMVVALTLTPALSMMLFSWGTLGRHQSPIVRLLARRYDNTLSRVIGSPRRVLIAAGACVLAAIVILPLLGTSLIPSFKDRDVLVRLDGEPGTSNPRMTRVTTQVSRELRNIPGVENVGAHVGRAVGSDQRVDVNSSEVWVTIDSGADYDATIASIENAVGRVQGAQGHVTTYTSQKIKDVGGLNEGDNPVSGDGLDVLTGADRPLTVRVFGQDQAVLRREASKMRQVVSDVDGVKDPRIEVPASQPNLEIAVDIEKARRVGIKPGDVRRAEATLLQGIEVGSVFEDQKVFEVIVKGTPATRRNVAAVRDLVIDRPDGGHVRLGNVADVRVATTPAVIKRDAVSRYLDIEADVSGRSLGDVANEIDQRVANISLPLEYHAEVLQQGTSKEINSTQMLAFGLAALIAAFLLLQAAFRSWRLAALAFLTLPVALVGGVLGALIDGAELSLGSLIGLLALFAIGTRNGLVLIRHFQDRERHEGETFGAELVQRGAREQVAPVLTSAAAIAVAMLPFVIMGSIPGLEIVHPMAVVILCGLVTTTLLTLFVLPTLYLRFGTGAKEGVTPEDELLYRWAGVQPAPAAAEATGVAAPALAERGEGTPARARGMGTQQESAASSAADAEEGESKEDQREPAV
jgi:CzcA family heavy metal efflux pump